jgi:Xaa-Pro aminopeptidase
MSKAKRIKRLRAAMEEKQLDAFLVSSPENRAYYSGFRGSAGYLWITATDVMLATDFSYTSNRLSRGPYRGRLRLVR